MKIGVIGGSGLYDWSGKDREQSATEKLAVQTPYGSPSDDIVKHTFGSHEVYFLARHGKGHTLSPSEINYRANIFALKKLGVQAVVSVCAVGSLKEDIRPGELVFPTQYIDRTRGIRPHSFFEKGVVGHAPFGEPNCSALRELFVGGAKTLNYAHHVGGAYICIEGPQFSTQAESHLYRSVNIPGGVSVIGMTAMPEAKLAREASLAYQTVALVTDYDCWREEECEVSVDNILKVLKSNISKAKSLLGEVFSHPLPDRIGDTRRLMEHAVITPKELWPESQHEIMEVILN